VRDVRGFGLRSVRSVVASQTDDIFTSERLPMRLRAVPPFFGTRRFLCVVGLGVQCVWYGVRRSTQTFHRAAHIWQPTCVFMSVCEFIHSALGMHECVVADALCRVGH